MSTLSIRDLDLPGRRVFMRVDFNVPLAPGSQEITSDKRIRASLPSIQYALDHGAGVVLASHLGRPKGKPNAEMSLKPVAEKLATLLGRPVAMAPDCVGPEVEAMLPKPGEVVADAITVPVMFGHVVLGAPPVRRVHSVVDLRQRESVVDHLGDTAHVGNVGADAEDHRRSPLPARP